METVSAVLDRPENNGSISTYLIDYRKRGNLNRNTSSSNNILDLISTLLSQTPRIKAKWSGPESNEDFNGSEIFQAVKQWASADLFAHYRDQGIETLLGHNTIRPEFIGHQDLGDGRSVRMFNLTEPIKNATGQILHPAGSTVAEQTLQKHGVKTGRVRLGEVVDWLIKNKSDFYINRII